MTFQRPCIGVNQTPCPTRALTTDRSGRCDHCRRQHWNSRGTSTERGYGQDHRDLRAAWQPLVEAGDVICWRCGDPIQPGEPWDMGHDDHDRSAYRGPSIAPITEPPEAGGDILPAPAARSAPLFQHLTARALIVSAMILPNQPCPSSRPRHYGAEGRDTGLTTPA